MHRQPPFGLYEASSPDEGLVPYTGAERPGPLGVDDSHPSATSPVELASRPQRAGPPAGVSTSFRLGTSTYRLLRVDTEWRQRFDEVRVPPEQAVAVLEHAARQQEAHDVGALLATAASELADLHENGVYVLLERYTTDARLSGPPSSAPASTPSALRPPAPFDTPLLHVEEPVMGLEQAKVLQDAAARGVPFCEECAKAAAARQAAAS